MTGTRESQSDTANVHRLVISSGQLREIVEHLQQWLPYEGCGLLAVDGDRVAKVFLGSNIAQSATFYEMDPKQVLDAMQEMDKRGLRLGAIFHSHPSTEAYPSPTDLELIFDPDVYMIIVSLAGDAPDVRMFRYDDKIIEVPLIVTDEAEGDG